MEWQASQGFLLLYSPASPRGFVSKAPNMSSHHYLKLSREEKNLSLAASSDFFFFFFFILFFFFNFILFLNFT